MVDGSDAAQNRVRFANSVSRMDSAEDTSSAGTCLGLTQKDRPVTYSTDLRGDTQTGETPPESRRLVNEKPRLVTCHFRGE